MTFALNSASREFLAAAIPLAVGYVLVSSDIQGAIGYTLIMLSLLVILAAKRSGERNYMFWLWLGVAILSITPIGTEVNMYYFVFMTTGVLASVIVPYALAHHYDKKTFIHMGLDFSRRWTRREVGYVALPVIMTAFWQPLYFLTTNAHNNWHFDTVLSIVVSFIVIMIIGLWEEFFFVALVLTIAKRYVPFWIANIIQASMFTSFLFHMGFRSWIVPLIMGYALYQGFVFHVTRSLLITISIHVMVDLIVFLSLLYSARPDLFG
ncbi:MAG: CPBP family intramembrane glutamic endopeptidase [Candidatus Saccharimonadales bacterium]